jgi:hypothetical protein
VQNFMASVVSLLVSEVGYVKRVSYVPGFLRETSYPIVVYQVGECEYMHMQAICNESSIQDGRPILHYMCSSLFFTYNLIAHPKLIYELTSPFCWGFHLQHQLLQRWKDIVHPHPTAAEAAGPRLLLLLGAEHARRFRLGAP